MDDQIVAFPDTNIFLHFKPFSEIPWSKELRSRSVCLRIAKVVIAELNQKKDSHPAEHIQERAQKALSVIRKAIFSQSGRLDAATALVCETTGSTLDMAARLLDPASNDDCILAAVLEYQEAHPEERVVLVTDDPGFALRAYSFGIEAVELSAKLKIPPRQDPKRKEIQELKQRIRDAEKRLPRLSFAFAGGTDRVEIHLQPQAIPTIEDARAYVAERLAPRFPLRDTALFRQWAAETKTTKLSDGAAAIFGAIGTFGEMMATKGNADITKYFEEW